MENKHVILKFDTTVFHLNSDKGTGSKIKLRRNNCKENFWLNLFMHISVLKSIE